MTQFAEPETTVEYARTRWEDGERRLQRGPGEGPEREELERVVEAIMQELERQVGQVFTSYELAVIQDSSEGWCTRIAHEVAPGAPHAWELDIVQNAAFHRYSRRASDYQLQLENP